MKRHVHKIATGSDLNWILNFNGCVTWNVIGQLLPMLVALIAIPWLLGMLGVERFGVFCVASTVVGYFSLFDFGLATALTKAIADRRSDESHDDKLSLMWTALVIMMGSGCAATLIILICTQWMVYGWLDIPLGLREESATAMRILALSVLPIIATAGLRGILEARHEFKLLGLMRVALGTLLYAAPLGALFFSRRLEIVLLAVLMARVASLIAHFLACCLTIRGFCRIRLSTRWFPVLFNTGTWVLISNALSAVVGQADVFLIGSLVSIAAVSHYSVPLEIAMRMLVIPVAVSGVCIPFFARSTAQKSRRSAMVLYRRSIASITCMLVPVTVLIELGASDALRAWLGEQFTEASASVMMILAIGALLSGSLQVSIAYLQGTGDAKVASVVQLSCSTAYIPLLVTAIYYYGIVGAAFAWSTRAAAESFAMYLAVHSASSETRCSPHC
jgi:O-antigen/teichoic acid export membrane protein